MDNTPLQGRFLALSVRARRTEL
jgi:hypothetical protein